MVKTIALRLSLALLVFTVSATIAGLASSTLYNALLSIGYGRAAIDQLTILTFLTLWALLMIIGTVIARQIRG